MAPTPEFPPITFPTLGFLIIDWIEAHAVVPDGFSMGAPFVLSGWQAWNVINHYRVKPDAIGISENQFAASFFYRRSQTTRPQKALALDTPIATPAGWTTMSEVQPGDMVFTPAGVPTRVLSKSPVWNSDTYRVTFSDGATLTACGDHEWVVDRRTSTSSYVRERLSTREILDAGIVDSGGARRFRVPVSEPLDLQEADLPIPPYVLGAWLGDGNSSDGRVTGIDESIFREIESEGYRIRQDSTVKWWQVYGLRKQLRLTGVLNNKHIPSPYLRASAAQRWSLLQGLMDTDGHADARQGKCEFVTTLPALRDGMRELLYSLGIKHVCYEGEAELHGRVTGPKWRIMFAARSDSPVFRLARKQARLRSPGGTHAQYRHRRIVSINPVECVPTQCLTVESDAHAFLAGREMIPTGNTGKGPFTASVICAEAVGPVLLTGWAVGGETYDCRDYGCGCGFVFDYEPGDPMGTAWPTPLIQLTATSEEQTDNIYGALRPMIEKGPLSILIPKTGEEFIRLPNGGRIDIVTSNARSRLGQRVTFVPQDETGLWSPASGMVAVAKAQRRGLAGMGGRAWETTNAWDPSENSVAQQTQEVSGSVGDIFIDFPQAAAGLSFRNKADRRKILRAVYSGSPWVNLDDIEGEAAELLLTDPENAERFFGNRLVYAKGTWLPDGRWADSTAVRPVLDGDAICLGFDGSENNDCTAIRAETLGGYQFTPTYGPDNRPTFWDPREWGGSIPREEVDAAVDELFERYTVGRLYADPQDWRSEIGDWALRFGEKKVLEWATNRTSAMYDSLRRFEVDLATGRLTHDACPMTEVHVNNARKKATPGQKYVLIKPADHQKIDLAMASALAHEAASDAVADGWGKTASRRVLVLR